MSPSEEYRQIPKDVIFIELQYILEYVLLNVTEQNCSRIIVINKVVENWYWIGKTRDNRPLQQH